MSAKAASRYARAFYGIAEEKSLTNEVLADFAQVTKVLADCGELRKALDSAIVNIETSASMLKAIFGGKLNELTVQLVLFLNSKKRASILADVCVDFEALFEQKNNIQRASISSAHSLTEAQVADIKSRLEKKTGKNIVISTSLDEQLIGGFRISVGDTVFDHSVKSQLENLQKRIVNS